MKRFCLFFVLAFLFFGCKTEIDYLLQNDSDFDISIYDDSTIDKREYNLLKKSSINIKHFDSGNFKLKNTDYPVDIFNGYSCTIITNKKTYILNVKNTTDKLISFSIPDNYLYTDFVIPANSEKKLELYIAPSSNKILSTYMYWQLKENQNVFSLVFF